MKLSIIIPVFNEEKTIGRVLENIVSITIPHIIKEIIVIDDGSSDATASNIKNQIARIKNIRFITHKTNYGKGAAVKTGIKYATGEYIVIQDADLEYNPQDITRLLDPILQKKAQVVYGTRLKRFPDFKQEEKSPQFFLHYIGNKFLSFVTSILYRQWITDMETGYKIFPKKAVVAMKIYAKGFEFEPEITAKLLKSGYKITEIPITTSPRGYSEGKKLKTFHDGFQAFLTIIKYRFTG